MQENTTSPGSTQTGLEIAIIGMAGRFPGAKNAEQFLDNIKNGVESIGFFSRQELLESGVDPGQLQHPNYVKAKGYVENIEYFDASFFDYLAQDAEHMDPQVRVFHECTWEALENAGYSPEEYEGLIGVYAGSSFNIQWMKRLLTSPDNSLFQQEALSLNFREYLSPRISYKFNLRGPSVTVNTACSTSLLAVHLACQGLLNGECNMALAGAVTISLPKKNGYPYHEGIILSSDGHCRAFDANANGTVFGNGAGVVVLKTLEEASADKDTIYAVIKGSAINNDGSHRLGFTAPGLNGQTDLIKAAHYMAEVEPSSLTYLEAHGTGTPLGDSIEIEALTRAFNTTEKGFCRLGSVKTNVGHLETAAGVAGLIKTALSLKHKIIPPSLHFTSSNPEIDFENSPFYVNTGLAVWETDRLPRRAGVNSFGIGGSNAYVILEEAPVDSKPVNQRVSGSVDQHQLILLSARTRPALRKMAENLAKYLEKNPGLNLEDVAYTLQVGRKAFEHHTTVVCSNVEDAVKQLSRAETLETIFGKRKKRALVFLFSAKGSPGNPLDTGIYSSESLFRREVDRCMGMETLRANNANTAHMNTFVYEYALARLLEARGVKPTRVMGDGIGEYTAACFQGKLLLEDGLHRALNPPDPDQPSVPFPFAQKLTGFPDNTDAGNPVLVELSKEAVFSSMVRAHPLVSCAYAPGAKEQAQSTALLLNCIAKLWMYGIKINWKEFHRGETCHRIPLPTYPFEGKYYWQVMFGGVEVPGKPGSVTHPRPELENPYEPPVSETQQAMKEIWQKYLGIEPIGVNDNFFQLGGDSLKGMIMLSHVQKELGMKIGISEFFQNPTIRELAKWTEQGAGAREEFSAIPPVEKKEYYVLSSAQKRLFTLQKLNPELINYNENFAVIIEGKLDKESIEQAFGHLIQRHESLRTSFHMQGEEPVQGIHDVVEFAIEYYDIGNRQQAIGNKEEPMPGPIIKDFIRPFDLSRAPLLRVGLLKTTGTKYILMVDMHHIITDGASQEILINDFLHLYQGNELPGLAIHYKDYSQWLNSESRQKTIKTQEAYWLKEFAAPAPVLNLPTDSPRPSLQSFEGNTCSFTIAREDTKKIKKLTAQYEVTLYMVFLALINVLMSKLSGNEDIIVGTVISGRIHAHLQKMVGMFVNVLCMRNSPCKDKTFREFLKEVKERTLQAFQNQDYQFEDLVEKTGGRRDPSRHPVFDIGFEFQGNDWSREMEENLKVRIPNFTIKSYSYKKKISRIDMIFFGRDARDQLYFHIEYCTKLFKEDTISNFIKYFKTILSLVLEEPGKKISDLDIIPAEEIQKIKDQLQEKNKEINIEFDL